MKGTIKQLVDRGLSCNGVLLTAADISCFSRLGIPMELGKQLSPSGKGKPSTLWEFPNEATLTFSFNPQAQSGRMEPPATLQWQEKVA